MKVNKVYCMFEQSGTFKREFQKLGIFAEDYDILNDFGETDHIIDLFTEIDKAYAVEKSVFDEVGKTDLVLAFFPCTRFESQIRLNFAGQAHQQSGWDDIQKLEYSMKLHEELHRLYILISKLFVISLRGGWRMIVENPATLPHYLSYYFPIKPTVVDDDRRRRGDYFKKPTQYWFVNCKPSYGLVFEPLEFVNQMNVEMIHKYDMPCDNKVKRSLIHPQYAMMFIREFILDGEVSE